VKVGFFRHGPAVPRGTEGVSEAERPLTGEGRKKTEQAARGLRNLDLGFDEIYTSPLPRARQTAEILAEVLHLSRPKSLNVLVPGTLARRLLQELRELDGEIPLLVGHEPLLSAAVSLAVGAASRSSVELKKAGMALVEFERIEPRPEGTLKLLLSPSALRLAARR
jgi:phosphohistidine phosphatase